MKRILMFVMVLVVVAMLASCGGEEVEVGTLITYTAATQEAVYDFVMNLDPEVYEVIHIGKYQETFSGPITYYVEYKEKNQGTTSANAESEQELATEHSHTWDVKEVAGTIVSFCTECGKIAE